MSYVQGDTIKHFEGDKRFPMLHVDKELIDALNIPWRNSLVVKLLGKDLEFNIMKEQLDNLWNLGYYYDLIEFGIDGFYIVMFRLEVDKRRVIQGVPWKIFDHYLSVCQVTSTVVDTGSETIDETRVFRSISPFDVPKETIKTMVWVRIKNLHPLYYDEDFLWTLASAIGHPVMVDVEASVPSERFARVCVDIELADEVAMVSSVGINGKWYPVEYEDSLLICTQCGSYGHSRSGCASKPSARNIKTE